MIKFLKKWILPGVPALLCLAVLAYYVWRYPGLQDWLMDLPSENQAIAVFATLSTFTLIDYFWCLAVQLLRRKKEVTPE